MSVESVNHIFSASLPALNNEVMHMPLWYWVYLLIAISLSAAIAFFLRRPLSLFIALVCHQKILGDKLLFLQKLRGPVHLFVGLIIFYLFERWIDEPTAVQFTIAQLFKLTVFAGVTYLSLRLIDLGFAKAIIKHQGLRNKVGLVLPLSRRVSKAALLIVAVLFVMAYFGIDVSAFLVGLGVGGLAIALAAQKILENLFGGAVLSLDQPFQVGDFCRCGDQLGTILKISGFGRPRFVLWMTRS